MNARLTAALVTGGAAAVAVAADRLSKRAVEQSMQEGELIRGPLGLGIARVTNDQPIRGSRSSAGNAALIGAGGLLAAGIGAAAVLLKRPPILQIGAGLVIGGMASNLYDRARGEGVTDFLRSPLGTVNLADLAIGAGIVAAGIGMAVR